jgi:hypothetical protein
MPQLDGDFGFCGPWDKAPNPNQDRQETINWYLESNKTEGAKVKYSLLGCPGLIQVASVVGL